MANFHEGEAHMQALAGVDTETFEARVGDGMLPELKPNEVTFVEGRTFSVATSIDAAGRPWTSPLFSNDGALFAVESPTVVHIDAAPAAGDPLHANIAATGELGVLYFDPSRRRRAKSLGKASRDANGSIRYEMTRNFGLCPKYIFKREHQGFAEPAAIHDSSESSMLSDTDRDQLTQADTIFLGSFHYEHGADATHRGGPAGFVEIPSPTTISIPDYAGNGMFNTFGNLVIDPHVSLLSIDFATGRTIQVTGSGSVASVDDDPLAERRLTIDIDSVIVTTSNVGHWVDIEEFTIRPGMANPRTPTVATRR